MDNKDYINYLISCIKTDLRLLTLKVEVEKDTFDSLNEIEELINKEDTKNGK